MRKLNSPLRSVVEVGNFGVTRQLVGHLILCVVDRVCLNAEISRLRVRSLANDNAETVFLFSEMRSS